MIYKLDTPDYEKVRSLYHALDYHLTIRAVIEGTSPGRIYVDDVQDPQAAFMSSVEGYYLAGDSENVAFNTALTDLIQRIGKNEDTVRDGEDAMSLDVYPQAWEAKLPTLFSDRAPLLDQRRKYLCTQLCVNWKELLPEGYSVHRIDEELLKQLGGNVPKHVLGWMKANWGGQESFLRYGFGFCVVHAERMVSWCIADCVSGEHCEVGIRTIPEYRRRGLAMIAVAATVDYCFSRGFKNIGWHCHDDNTGSWKTAEKVGFVKERGYVFHLYLFDEATHLAETGWRCVKAKRYQEAVIFFEQVLALKPDAPHYWYHSAAMACAGAGDSRTAFAYLHTAIEKSWQHLDFTQSREEFAPLYGTPEWEAIVAQLESIEGEKG